MFLRKLGAFIKRDFLIEASYRLNFLLRFLGNFLFILIFYFIARLFGNSPIPYLELYGGDYFSFVLIGIAFSDYLGLGLTNFSQKLRQEQLMGTLEAILATPTKIPLIIFSSSGWEFIHTSIEIFSYLLLGIFLFGVRIAHPNLLSILIILILSLISFSSLGIISASFIMVFKRGDPLNWLLISIFHLFGGVYFPITILPGWLQKVSYCLPLTYSLHGLRLALLKGSSLWELMPDILALSLFSLIMLPVSLFAFGYAVRMAKIKGSLTHY